MESNFDDALAVAETLATQTRLAFLNAFYLAPDDRKREVHSQAVAAGMYPTQADGLDPQDDSPCYTLDSIVRHLGLTEDDPQIDQIHQCFTRIDQDNVLLPN